LIADTVPGVVPSRYFPLRAERAERAERADVT
jgi:hypothetical protein